MGNNYPPIHEASFWQAVSRPSFLKFLFTFVIVLGAAWGGYFYWKGSNEQMQQVRDYEQIMEQYTAIHKNDTYGGSTPQETLDLFIAALEAGDPELATMYFLPDDNGSREKWHQVMLDTYNAGNFPSVVEALKIARPDESGIIGEKFYRFISRDEKNYVIGVVEMTFNGRIWKIDNI